MSMMRWIGLIVAAAMMPFSAARAEWREATSEHFVILSEGNERQLIETSQRLEAVHWLLALATGHGTADDGRRVRIYLVNGVSDVWEGAGAPANSPMIAVYMSHQMGPIAIAVRRRPNSDLFHEYAHHFMFEYMGARFPPWFVEGFAEVVSTASFEREGAITYGKVADQRSNELHYGEWTPTERMFAERSSENGHAGVASYGQYWLTAHYLLFAQERRGQLQRFIRAINSGQEPDEAAVANFPGGLGPLDNDLRRYLREANFRYVAPALPADMMRSPSVRIMRPGEAAIIELEMVAIRTRDVEGNAALAGRVATIVAQHPYEPAAHALHSSVLFAAEQYSDAIAAADRALAIDSNHARANAFRALAMLSAANADGGIQAEIRNEALAYFQRARTSDDREPAVTATARMLGNIVTRVDTNNAHTNTRAVVTHHGNLPVLTSNQSDRLRTAYLLIGSDNSAARLSLIALATESPGTGLESLANRLIAWLDGDRHDPLPRIEWAHASPETDEEKTPDRPTASGNE